MKTILASCLFCCLAVFGNKAKRDFFTLNDLTLEQKIGQVLMAYFDGEELNEYGRRLLEKTYLGSYIYFPTANGEKNHAQMKKFTKQLQDYMQKNNLPPLFICCDQEGGRLLPLKEGFTPFPGNGALGKAQDLELAYLTGLYQGYELKSCGVNLNLAPVVDVNNNPKNPIIGARSFSDKAQEVKLFASKVMEGFHEAPIFCCLKHYPGHGDVSVDSHISLPVVDKSLEELKQTELSPFYFLQAKAPFIMTAHIVFPQLDTKPATLSKKILQDILRKDLKYEGIILSDSLVMKGVLPEEKKLEEVALQAFLAGCDLLCIGGDFEENRLSPKEQVQRVIRVYNYLLTAAKKGDLPIKRLDESVTRILKLKNQKNYFSTHVPEYAKKDSLLIAQKTAKKACKILQGPLEPLYNKKVLFFIPHLFLQGQQDKKHAEYQILFNTISPNHSIYYYDPKNFTFDEKKLLPFDAVVFFAYSSWLFSKQQESIEKIALLKPTYCIGGTENELDLLKNPQIKIASQTLSPLALETVAHALKDLEKQ